jgi:hypothetical protein
MSDFSPIDDDDVSEQLDDEVLGGQPYPPDRYIDPDDPGATLPDTGFGGVGDQPEVQVLAQGSPDHDEDVLAEAVVGGSYGALADDDEFTGDETTRDVATERVPPAAEEAALHIVDDDG